MIIYAAQTIAALLLGVGVLLACREVRRHDPVAGLIVQCGVLLRLVTGLVMFWISYLNAPLLRGIHSGDGFWESDARDYFEAAAVATRHGLSSINSESASPAFVRALAILMDIVGVSPATGVYLNLLCYVGLCLLVSTAFGAGIAMPQIKARRLILCCFTVSPALLIASAQSLKDQFFVFWIAVAALAALFWVSPMSGTHQRGSALTLALTVMCTAVYVIAGIRPYVAFLVIAAIAGLSALYLVRQSLVTLVPHLLKAMTAVLLLWGCFAQGAGPYYPFYESHVTSLFRPGLRPDSAPQFLESARAGFEKSGGRTNIVRIRGASDGSTAETVMDRVVTVGVGIALLTVPAAAVDAMGIVDIPYTGGLVRVIDLDTIFVVMSCGLTLAFMARHRAFAPPAMPYIIFGLGLSAVTTVLMAYVVTNLGTLFRLRMMLSAWIWLLPLALAIRPAPRADGDREERARRGRARSTRGRINEYVQGLYARVCVLGTDVADWL